MRINYEDIITKANARKEALQALEAEFTDMPDIVQNFTDCLDYFINLGTLAAQLDLEGQQIFGKNYRGVYDVARLARDARESFFKDPGYKQARLLELVAMANGQESQS